MTPLELAREKRRELVEQGVKLERKNPIEKSRDNPNSLKAAINAKCYECVCGDMNSNWKTLVKECEVGDNLCSLWKVRPYQ